MKKKLLALLTSAALLVSSVGFAADTTFEDVIKNTQREYSEYISKAIELLTKDGIEADADKATIYLMAEATDFDDDDIDHTSVFVNLPEKDSKDFYAVSFYSETKKHSGTAKNFDINGRLKDLYSSEVKELVESIENPEEIVNMWLGGRLSFLVYHIDAQNEDYVVLYDVLPDTGANYNEMGLEEFEIEEGKIYTEDEFLRIIHGEADAYREYLKEKEGKEVKYVGKDGDEKVKNPSKDYDDDEDELCTCKNCPDKECAADPYDCDCDLADCTSEDCREEARENEKEKSEKKDKESKKDKDDKDELCTCKDCPDKECAIDPYDCDCDLADCTSEDCREDALEDAKKKEKRKNKIKKVNEYGVFKGNEKGELKEDEYITRAEFAVVVCKILGLEPEEGKISDEFEFDDVDDKHWAKEYIKIARKTGFISGRGGNKYDPDARISYEEAMKILVAAMGYTPMAEQKGGYPYGYTNVAKNLGVPTDLTFNDKDEALRGDVMEMVYNSLDVPMLLQKVFGDRAEYEIADGTNGKEMTIRIILELRTDK